MRSLTLKSDKICGGYVGFSASLLVLVFFLLLTSVNVSGVFAASGVLADEKSDEKMDQLLQRVLELDDILTDPNETEQLDISIPTDEEEPVEMDTPAKNLPLQSERFGKDGTATSGVEAPVPLETDQETPKKRVGEKLDRRPANVLPPDAETPVVGLDKIDPDSVGNPFSAKMIKLMYDEINNGLNARGVMNRFYMFRDYARMTLNNTNRLVTGSEVDGRCRLSWYDKLYRNPLDSVFEVEEFSRFLHAGLSGNHVTRAQTMTAIREKLDIAPRMDDGVRFAFVQSPDEALQEVIRCVTTAQSEYARALLPLNSREIATLNGQLYNIFCAKETHGHTLDNRKTGRDLLQLLEKMDRTGIHNAIEALIPLSDEHLLELLEKLPAQRIVTAAGDIVIGGPGDDVYDLDAPNMMNVVAIIETGGNDTYREGTCSLQRPVFVIIDLSGNDRYIATKPGVQGGSIMGISMLIDVSGNDSYQAADVAQGSTIGGAGILIDKSGDDKYVALRRAQGQALGGVGILIDEKGNDDYRAAMWAQGFGNPAGFGILEDVSGNDHYYLGGLWLDSYPEHPGYDGWGQGLGAGLRGVANGGIGALLEGGGDDFYEFDYIAHGGGYWLGVGFLRDFGGNDKHIASTLTDYYNKPRKEARWQRFSNGFAVHYALGYLFEDEGDDVYESSIMGQGMAWDMSAAFLCDFGGNDQYLVRGSGGRPGGLTQGIGAEGSLGVLFDYFGNDVYGPGGQQGYASSSITYHNPSQCGANFSFLIDYGGTDQYGSGAKNNSYNTRGSATGFLIDRPLETEPVPEPPKSQQPQQRSQQQPQQRPQQQLQQRPQQQPQRPQQRPPYPPQRR